MFILIHAYPSLLIESVLSGTQQRIPPEKKKTVRECQHRAIDELTLWMFSAVELTAQRSPTFVEFNIM